MPVAADSAAEVVLWGTVTAPARGVASLGREAREADERARDGRLGIELGKRPDERVGDALRRQVPEAHGRRVARIDDRAQREDCPDRS